ncbi:MBL fold metallo-hydrolase [Candidatus Bathyarchaeota archaeon]|nr:MBL fold metallo-hydrolase [Candidatus Bathyarchaeota archaeon]
MNENCLSNGINWVGVIDWNIRDFHGYITRRGTTYNSYLILDKKIALVDTVKSSFSKEFLDKIQEITDLEKIDYIIINHVEMDHSSSLPIIAELAKNATIIASQRGKEAIIEHYGENFPIKTAKTGDEIDLGNRRLRFIEAPMLHWPDSMFTYIVEEKILLSNDAFGQHLASAFRFDDEIEENVLMEEAITYYANILMPLGSLVSRKIQEIVKMGISPKIIAPSHGIIWRSNPSKIIQAYLDWSIGKSKMKAVVVFDTMWNSTNDMARAITKGLISEGVETKLLKLRSAENTDIITEILTAKAVIVGSPTLNQQMFPSLGAFLTYITGLKPRGKLWSFFGSYGWSRGAVKSMTEIAKRAGFEIINSGLEVKYVPNKDDLKMCFDFGKEIAKKIKS